MNGLGFNTGSGLDYWQRLLSHLMGYSIPTPTGPYMPTHEPIRNAIETNFVGGTVGNPHGSYMSQPKEQLALQTQVGDRRDVQKVSTIGRMGFGRR